MKHLPLLALIGGLGALGYLVYQKVKAPAPPQNQVGNAVVSTVQAIGGLLSPFWDGIPTDIGNPGGATARPAETFAATPVDATTGPTSYVPLAQRIFAPKVGGYV